MSSNERHGDYLETGLADGVSPDDGERLDLVRDLLADESTWLEPSDNLRLSVVDTGAGSGGDVNWWMWVAGALALVLATIGLANIFDEEEGPTRPNAVATMKMSGTELAAGAGGTAELIPTPNGWAIAFDVEGLPPAADGTFYEAWVSDGTDSVSVGSFHMRGEEATPIGLWSGVDLHDYRTLNVTIEMEGDGPESSGVLVMTGSTPRFD